MWEKSLKKTIYTLNVGNSYPSEITDLTYPLLKEYARKIDAEFYVITERKFPQHLEVYEKFQIYDLAKEHKNDWNIFFDCDTLIHPDTPDLTIHIDFDTVAHHGNDMASIRWKYNNPYLLRDGRLIGSCNWCAIASAWCTDLWHPSDLTPDQIAENIFPIVNELQAGITPIRLIDDYICSLNIARYGLKFTTVAAQFKKMGMDSANFFFHQYAIPSEEKVIRLREVIKHWNLS